jgi:hypothetical protein
VGEELHRDLAIELGVVGADTTTPMPPRPEAIEHEVATDRRAARGRGGRGAGAVVDRGRPQPGQPRLARRAGRQVCAGVVVAATVEAGRQARRWQARRRRHAPASSHGRAGAGKARVAVRGS